MGAMGVSLLCVASADNAKVERNAEAEAKTWVQSQKHLSDPTVAMLLEKQEEQTRVEEEREGAEKEEDG